MRRLSIFVLIPPLAILATACATQEQAGTLSGGGLGGAAGKTHTRGSLVGALFGAATVGAMGADIGRQLDDGDRLETAYALEHARTGELHEWVNQDSGRRYSCMPTSTFYRSNRPCRDFVLLATIAVEPTELHGTACRAPDGTWHTVEG